MCCAEEPQQIERGETTDLITIALVLAPQPNARRVRVALRARDCLHGHVGRLGDDEDNLVVLIVNDEDDDENDQVDQN